MIATDTATGPFDSTDEAVLRELRETAARLDPCPADLAERVKFALTVQALQAEVAQLTSQPELVSRTSATQEPAEAPPRRTALPEGAMRPSSGTPR